MNVSHLRLKTLNQPEAENRALNVPLIPTVEGEVTSTWARRQSGHQTLSPPNAIE